MLCAPSVPARQGNHRVDDPPRLPRRCFALSLERLLLRREQLPWPCPTWLAHHFRWSSRPPAGSLTLPIRCAKGCSLASAQRALGPILGLRRRCDAVLCTTEVPTPSPAAARVVGQCACGRITGLNRPAFGPHSLDDRSGPLDREPRMPEMQKDRHRQAFASERARLSRRRPRCSCRSRSRWIQGCLY